jgi:hypothetical protein
VGQPKVVRRGGWSQVPAVRRALGVGQGRGQEGEAGPGRSALPHTAKVIAAVGQQLEQDLGGARGRGWGGATQHTPKDVHSDVLTRLNLSRRSREKHPQMAGNTTKTCTHPRFSCCDGLVYLLGYTGSV